MPDEAPVYHTMDAAVVSSETVHALVRIGKRLHIRFDASRPVLADTIAWQDPGTRSYIRLDNDGLPHAALRWAGKTAYLDGWQDRRLSPDVASWKPD